MVNAVNDEWRRSGGTGRLHVLVENEDIFWMRGKTRGELICSGKERPVDESVKLHDCNSMSSGR